MNLLDVISIIATVGLTILAVFFLFGLALDDSKAGWLERISALITTRLNREP